jgi:membrane protein required for colicin V production
LQSLTALAGVIVGTLAAAKYYPSVQVYLTKISSLDPHISMILSMLIIFVGIQIAFAILRRILRAILDFTRLSWLDRTLGAGMGVLAGLLISAVTVQAVLIGLPEWPMVKESKLLSPVNQLTSKALDYVPQQTRDAIQAFITKWKTPEPIMQPQPRQTGPVQKAPGGSR